MSVRTRRSRWIAAIGAVLTGAALFVAWHAREAGRIASEAGVSLVRERTALELELRRMKGRVDETERAGAELRSALATLQKSGGAKEASERAATAPRPAARTMSEIMASDPRLEVLELQRQRLALHGDYGYVMHALRLSPEQIKTWEELKAKETEASMDLSATARTQDESGKRTVVELQQQARRQYETALATLLGPEAYQRLQDYEKTIPLRNVVVNGFAGLTALEGCPLSDRQGEQLMRAMIESGGADVTGPKQDLAGIDWTAVEARARQFLSPEQYTLFTTVAPATSFSSRWEAMTRAAIESAVRASAKPSGSRGG